MDAENRKLLDEVIEDRLDTALGSDVGTEEGKVAFKEAMEAVDRRIELAKLDASSKEQEEKRKLEEEKQQREELAKKKEQRVQTVIRIVEIGLALIAVPVMEHIFKKDYMRDVCTFEKDYTFTTSAGKAVSGIFRFKK